MPYCECADAKIYFEVYGDGFPVFLFAPGGMWSNISKWRGTQDEPVRPVHDWTEVLSNKFTVVAMDQRNAGLSSGAISSNHGWDTYSNDQLAVMDYLGFTDFHTLGGCIGGSFCLNIARLAPERVASVVLQNPIGLHPKHPEYFPDSVTRWAEELSQTRDDINPNAIESFKNNMFGSDFVFSVTRDFVHSLKTPAMLMHGKDKPHPASISAELEKLLPVGTVSLKNWERPEFDKVQRNTVIQFLESHTPRDFL